MSVSSTTFATTSFTSIATSVPKWISTDTVL
jgi:hypothetical protein